LGTVLGGKGQEEEQGVHQVEGITKWRNFT